MSRKIYYTPRTKNLKERIDALMKEDFILYDELKVENKSDKIKVLVRDIINLSVQNMAHWHNIRLEKEDFAVYDALGVGEEK